MGGALKGCLATIGGVVVLLVIIGIVVGSKGSSPTGPTQSPALVTPEPKPNPAPGEATPNEATPKQTEPKPTQEVAPQAPQVFKGSGIENIGTISVSVASTLRWSCSTCNVFSVSAISTSGTESISLDANARTAGVTAVEPGTYHGVNVIANEQGGAGTGWTIRITAGQ